MEKCAYEKEVIAKKGKNVPEKMSQRRTSTPDDHGGSDTKFTMLTTRYFVITVQLAQ